MGPFAFIVNAYNSYDLDSYGMRGPSLSSSTACATGLNAIGDASTFISMGRVERMIAGATESCVNPIAVVGFQRLR